MEEKNNITTIELQEVLNHLTETNLPFSYTTIFSYA